MKKIFSTGLFVASVLFVAAGCAPTEEAPADASGTKTSESKMDSSTTAELAKCDLCGKEVAKSDLTPQDGKMWCKDCMSSHQHG